MKCNIILRMHMLIALLIALERVKMVKIGSVVIELKWGRKWKLCQNWTIFVHLAFWNGLEYHNFDLSMLTGNHFCTVCENFVRFGIVTPEVYAKEVVRPESIIVTTLSSPMFAMGLGCKALRWSVSFFHKYSLGGDTTAQSGLFARLCDAFLWLIFCAPV